ncbi:hypothetical protein, partial [Cryptosporangium minutisporangium]|uniref:hypothetical protein n=1 Tax=Cryptosporangium minutisporangium TaxID=113569 RepID=UPI0035E91282
MTLFEHPPSADPLRSLKDLPRPLDAELPRERLTRALERRWHHAITFVVAGAGFGKTTALAQTVRAHALDPRGIDTWVSCEPRHEDTGRLARAVLDALPGPPPGRSGPANVRDVLAALIALAPDEVCLTVDDVHELPAGSPGAAFLRDLVAALPATVHLVLSGREVPDVPVARREAAGAVLHVRAEDLAFSDAEVAALGRRLAGRSDGESRSAGVTRAETFDGWPALVRLAFAAGPSAPLRFVREEILGGLCETGRRSLAVLAALGTATSAEVDTVLRRAGYGCASSLDPVQLAHRIPLVSVLDDGRVRVHDLWTDAVARVIPAPELGALRRAAVILLAERGDLSRAGAVACAASDWEQLAELAVKLVRESLTALPLATAERWLAEVPAAAADRPAFTLLRAAALQARDYTHPLVDGLLDQAWDAAQAADAADTASATLGQAVVAAHSRADLARLASLACRADQLRSSPSPVVRLLRHTVAGVLAELRGDPEAAIAEFAAAPVREVLPLLALPVLRFHVHCLTLTGHHADAADLADRTLDEADDVHTRVTGAMARWFGGDPAVLDRLRTVGLLRPDAGADHGADVGDRANGPPNDTVREAFVTRAQAAVLAASCGTAADWPTYPVGNPADHGNARDATLAAAAASAVAVAHGDEAAARRIY